MKSIKINKPIRSHTGEKWITNSSNKKYLAKDFDNRCGYCDDWDRYSGGYNAYHVEHFAPKEKFKHLRHTYDNLLYCCPYCNMSKSNKWVGATAEESIVGNEGFIDPCTDEYYDHIFRDNYGNIGYLTPLGRYIFFELKLYLKRHSIIYNLDQLRLRRIALQSKINEKSQRGENVDQLKKIRDLLSVVLCDYYELFLMDDEC